MMIATDCYMHLYPSTATFSNSSWQPLLCQWKFFTGPAADLWDCGSKAPNVDEPFQLSAFFSHCIALQISVLYNYFSFFRWNCGVLLFWMCQTASCFVFFGTTLIYGLLAPGIQIGFDPATLLWSAQAMQSAVLSWILTCEISSMVFSALKARVMVFSIVFSLLWPCC